MPGKTKIEWTDVVWNPITGCTKVSPGCDNCYAERFAERWRGIPGHHFEQGFDLRIFPERFDQPRRWRKPRRIFVNSMSDLFHGSIQQGDVFSLLDVMREVDRHTYQILTKRSRRMMRLVNAWTAPFQTPRHIWIGVSVENQEQAERRIPDLMKTRATVRFLSVEPLLERVGLAKYLRTGDIHWVIVGGESGPGARPMMKDWATDVRDICWQYRVPFFFKQWGGIRAKAGGRILDGRTWDEMPATGIA